ncbi:unnamed protein product [Mytilus coruscus]|uniref:C3H1-type domain-containing protein n=1 Tax=Mytilus coruscus TaxID=42192 RepID=A0A6J8CPF6_MYTCO|nr:unnamed protein product [Mytilus coruscus]
MPGGKKSLARGKKSPARGQGGKKRRMADSQEPTIEHNERYANKSHGWGTYDEQFRLLKAQRPQSSWAFINQDLLSFYITTAMRDQGQSNDNKVGIIAETEPLHSFRQPSCQQNFQQARICNAYNTKGKRCNFNPCRFKHTWSVCGGQHPPFYC